MYLFTTKHDKTSLCLTFHSQTTELRVTL